MNLPQQLAVLLMVGLITACSDTISSTLVEQSSLSSETTSPTQNAFLDDYPLAWEATTRLMFSITIQPSHLILLNDLGKEKNGQYNDVYLPVDVTVRINDDLHVIKDVGMRMKGNIFSRGSFLEDDVIVRPFHFRLRFNELFDEQVYALFNLKQTWTAQDTAYQARKNRRLFGLTSLEFKWNRSDDPSLINQVFAANQYIQHNLLAPRTSLAEIHLQDGLRKYQFGLYTMSEPIDERFIERHFSPQAAKGDLYKALYPVTLDPMDMGTWNMQTNTFTFFPNLVGVEDTLNYYHPVYDLKTNKKTSSHHALKRLMATFASLPFFPVEEQLHRLKSVVHLESFLQYAAISYLIGNPDDMRNNKNNTYLYFDSESQLAYFIPYDLDWSLGIIWDQTLSINQTDYSPFSPFGTYGIITNPLYWLTVFGPVDHPLRQVYPIQTTSQMRYRVYLKTYFEDPLFSTAHFQNMMSTYQATYPNVLTSFDTNSTFLHYQTFSSHHQLITTQILHNT